MTHPALRRSDLRVEVPAREPDDALLHHLASLARASGTVVPLAEAGPSRWRVALVAASVAAIAGSGAALAASLRGDEQPPMTPPTTELPSDDESDLTERQRRPHPKPKIEEPRSAPDPRGEGQTPDAPPVGAEEEPPGDEDTVPVPEEDPVDPPEPREDDGPGEDDGDDDGPDDRDDNRDDRDEPDDDGPDEPDDKDEPDEPDAEDADEDSGESPGGSRDD